MGNVSSSNRDTLNRGSDHISFCDGDDVCDTITRVDNSTGEGSVGNFGGGPRSGKCKYGLHSDVHTGAIEGFKEDFGGVLAVFGRIQGLEIVSGSQEDISCGSNTHRFSQEEVVVLRLNSEVLEDGMRPESLHMVPVLDLAMSNWIVNAISWATTS